MIERDEQLRDAITDAFTRANIDARNLAVEVVDGDLIVQGTVPSEDTLQTMRGLLLESHFGAQSVHCHVRVLAAAPSDSDDGRGRSPVTGVSADSAHESRHQLDKS